jgi:hypothetical protein
MKSLAEIMAEGEASAPRSPIRSLADIMAEGEAPVAAEHEDPAAPAPSVAVPLTPERKAKVDADIARTSLPVPSKARTAWDATLDAFDYAGNQFGNKALGGIPGRVSEALMGPQRQVDPLPEPGKRRRPEDYIPSNAIADVGTSIGATGTDMAAVGGAFGKVGETISQAPAAIARRLGASEAASAVRPSLQAATGAAGSGALYSAADTAVRGGSPEEVLASMPAGAAGNLAMSALPAVAGAVEGKMAPRVVANDLRQVKQMAKKGTLDKSLIQFGNGDPEAGAREMQDFVAKENLGPVFREKGSAALTQFEKMKNRVWEDDLKPIYAQAKKADPKASVPFDEIANRLRTQVSKRGGNEQELVEAAISKIKNRTDMVREDGVVPLDVLLTNARDFQSAGHAGVVNYDAPPESKKIMRDVGRSLRGMANERVAAIYSRNPEAAQELFTGQKPAPMGITNRDQPSTPGTVRSDAYPNAWARRYQNAQEYAQDVPRLLAEGNRRYSDFAKLEPLVRQASTLKAGEKRFGLMGLLSHGMSGGLAGTAGYAIGGDAKSALLGMGLSQAAQTAAPYVTRGVAAGAGALAGPAVNPGIAGAEAQRLTLPQLKAYAESVLNKRRDKGR